MLDGWATRWEAFAGECLGFPCIDCRPHLSDVSPVFTEPTPGEDRNRLIIPGCAVRACVHVRATRWPSLLTCSKYSGINAFALQDVDSAPPSSLLHPARITCLNTAVDAAVMLLSTALSSATYSVTLSYSIVSLFKALHSNVSAHHAIGPVPAGFRLQSLIELRRRIPSYR